MIDDQYKKFLGKHYLERNRAHSDDEAKEDDDDESKDGDDDEAKDGRDDDGEDDEEEKHEGPFDKHGEIIRKALKSLVVRVT